MGIRENKGETHLREQIQALGGDTRKWVSSGRDGVPDQIVFVFNSVFFVEVKTIDGEYEPGKKLGDDRLPNFWMLSLGLEKTFKVSDTVTTTVFVDAYNVTNNVITLKVDTRLGRTNTDDITRVLNPGIFQFGVRVNF